MTATAPSQTDPYYWRNDPNWANKQRPVKDTGYSPRRYQSEIHASLTKYRFGVLVCHRRFGKTVCAINTLIDAALRFNKPNGRFGYIAPYLKQAKRVSWGYLKAYTRAIGGRIVSEGDLIVKFPNGAQISITGADNPDAIRGDFFDGVVLDEIADFRPEVWGTIIRPMLVDRDGWALFIGTPRGMNLFHELYQDAILDPDWYAALYRADETGVISDEELDLCRKAMTSVQFRQEFLCDFTASMDNVLITIDLISNAVRRAEVSVANLKGLPKIMGVDIARFGDDRSVIQRRWGHVALEPIVYQSKDNMEMASNVAYLWRDWQPDAVFIDGGRGEGVIDRLRQLHFDPIEVQFGASPGNPRYNNKRTEMWDTMRSWVEERGSLPNNLDLKADLCVPTFDFKTERMRLESKEHIKERGGRSTDMGDALALTFAMPVAAKTNTDELPGDPIVGKMHTEYDAYADEEEAA